MVKKNRKEKIRDLAKSYEPTPQERAALEAYRIQEEDSPLAPRLRVTENDGATTICPDHPKQVSEMSFSWTRSALGTGTS